MNDIPQRFRRAVGRFAALALGAGVLALATGGCDDPACVYSGTCFNGAGGGGTLGANPASVPAEHAWLAATPPQLTAFFPSGTEIASTTPIVLRFSESITFASTTSAFELLQLNNQQGGGFGGQSVPVPLQPPALLGDGRLLVLVPATALQSQASYELRLREGQSVYDLTGTPLPAPAEGIVGSFSVASIDPDRPRVVTSWPPDGTAGQSPTGEVAVVFDRRLEATSVTVDSFAITVDGAPPAQNPAPQAAVLAGGSGLATTDTRAWRWRSTDDDGQAVPLGLAATVELSLSPEGDEIVAEDGSTLAPTQLAFDLAGFTAPEASEIVSLPTDAIGIANLDGSLPLEVAVEIQGGLSSDRLGIFVFGTTKSATPQLGALFRETTLGQVGYDPGTGIATLGEDVLDLASSTAPVEARFADGTVSFALRLERGDATSAVRLLDVDRERLGAQSPRLDTTRPVLEGLGLQGSALGSLRSDLRDLVVVGRASEPVRVAEVSTALGDNGTLPPVIAYDEPEATLEAGLFAAAPVALGQLPAQQLPLEFTVLVYDRAYNAADAPTTANFRQLGGVGPGASLPGGSTVAIEVFDAASLAAVGGARVFTHAYTSASPVLVDSGVTGENGRVNLLAAASGETLVTVDADGYDLFTFQDLPVARLGVPLSRALQPPALHQGVLSTPDANLSNLTKWAHEPRLLEAAAGLVAVESCSFNPLTLRYDCLFGPEPLAAGRLGASALDAVNPPPNEFVYTASGFLKAWSARLPGLALEGGQPSALAFSIERTLDAAGVGEEERALDGPALELDASALSTLDLGGLVSEPIVTIEARMRGLPGALLAGHGVSFPLAGSPIDTWRVRCAFPGAVDFTDDKYPGDQLGPLVAQGIIDPDLFLRLELRDTEGRVAVRRPRFSTVTGTEVLAPRDAPRLLSPTEGEVTSGPSYPVSFEDRLEGLVAGSGLHNVTLTGSDGRRWHLWRPVDLDGASVAVTLWVPPIAAAGGNPLAAGPVTAVVESLTWRQLDSAHYLWSDLEREYDVRVRSAPVGFLQP